MHCLPTSPPRKKHLSKRHSDFVATQKLNADRPEGHLSLGNLHARQGMPEEAGSEYETAIKLWPGFIPAYVNLADLYRARGQDEQAEHWLLEAQKKSPQNADVIHSLALLRVRQHRTKDVLELLAKAAQLAPNNAHYTYVYGVGLYSSGKTAAGLDVLRKANDKFPADREILLALVSFAAESGDLTRARRYAERFESIAPADGRGQEILMKIPATH